MFGSNERNTDLPCSELDRGSRLFWINRTWKHRAPFEAFSGICRLPEPCCNVCLLRSVRRDNTTNRDADADSDVYTNPFARGIDLERPYSKPISESLCHPAAITDAKLLLPKCIDWDYLAGQHFDKRLLRRSAQRVHAYYVPGKLYNVWRSCTKPQQELKLNGIALD